MEKEFFSEKNLKEKNFGLKLYFQVGVIIKSTVRIKYDLQILEDNIRLKSFENKEFDEIAYFLINQRINEIRVLIEDILAKTQGLVFATDMS